MKIYLLVFNQSEIAAHRVGYRSRENSFVSVFYFYKFYVQFPVNLEDGEKEK